MSSSVSHGIVAIARSLNLTRQTEINGIHGKLRQSTSQFEGSDNQQNKSHANQLTIKAIIFFISFTMHTARAGQYVPLFMAKHKEQKDCGR